MSRLLFLCRPHLWTYRLFSLSSTTLSGRRLQGHPVRQLMCRGRLAGLRSSGSLSVVGTPPEPRCLVWPSLRSSGFLVRRQRPARRRSLVVSLELSAYLELELKCNVVPRALFLKRCESCAAFWLAFLFPFTFRLTDLTD